MAVTTDVQAGLAKVRGILSGASPITFTSGSFTVAAGTTGSIDSQDSNVDANVQHLNSTDGTIRETSLASARVKKVTINYAPAGATRAAALANLQAVQALGHLAVWTLTTAGNSFLNGTYNMVNSPQIKETREGVCMVGINLEAPETATAGSFAALAVISG